ncbi:hypothetical protein [Parasitella parasitica]|uniref:Uncharacterized protein n=1 Tax=Parasitella parasitica TaxID=35722 RepID=A0A0B7NAQ6_9FUNG|nr:hypothetical protein [Parasitella parasitica]
MRSSIFSALFIASAVSTTLCAPTASSALAESFSAVSEAQQAEASVDPRIARWARMKVALPDGLFPEDKIVLEEQLQVVPMIMVDDLPQPTASSRKLIDKHQRIDIEPAYKHMSLMRGDDDLESSNFVEVTPLAPEIQQDFKQKQKASFSNVEQGTFVVGGRRYRKYLGVSDNGESQIIDLPTPANTPDLNVGEQEETQGSLQAKKIVGLDKQGRMRYVDIPFYNRGGYN